MKLKDWLKSLNEQVTENPEILEYDVVYSSDDEGNNFDFVHYNPTVGEFKEEEFGRGYYAFNSDSVNKNAICIN